MYDREKKNRYDYRGEIYNVLDKIKRTCDMYKEQGCNVTLLFLGDIFHGSYKYPMMSMIDQNEFLVLRNHCTDIYSVIGNHELHFPKDNPFWALTSEGRDNINNKPRVPYVTLGQIGVIGLTDRLIDGNVVFNFNHYGSNVLTPLPDKVNIGLFHQEIDCSPAIKSAEILGLQPYKHSKISLETYDVLGGYNYSYFGHFHKYYGTWKLDDGRIISYLGSLGRPSQDEVNDKFLERTIPAVIVEDGNLLEVNSVVIELERRATSVKEHLVKVEQEKREVYKDRKTIQETFIVKDTVRQSLESHFNHELYRTIIDGLINNENDIYYNNLMGGN